MKDQIFSKVILSGEHSVLRGGLAIVAPLKSKLLSYKVTESETFQIVYSDKTAPYEILVEGTFEKAFSLLNKSKTKVQKKVSLESLVPLGKGLGGSAALCVFVTRSMKNFGFLKEEDVFSFAMKLENMFHGESSGLDIAGCLSEGPVAYVRGEHLEILDSKCKDIVFGLSVTSENGDTEECIEKVLAIKNSDKNLFYSLDSDMNEASKKLKAGLISGVKDEVSEAIAAASKVFSSWGLVTKDMHNELENIRSKGALAVKPTGSGLGGCILSLWGKSDLEKARKVCGEVFEL